MKSSPRPVFSVPPDRSRQIRQRLFQRNENLSSESDVRWRRNFLSLGLEIGARRNGRGKHRPDPPARCGISKRCRAAASARVSRSSDAGTASWARRDQNENDEPPGFHARAFRLKTTRFVTRNPRPIAMKAIPRTTNSRSLSKNRADRENVRSTSMPRFASKTRPARMPRNKVNTPSAEQEKIEEERWEREDCLFAAAITQAITSIGAKRSGRKIRSRQYFQNA